MTSEPVVYIVDDDDAVRDSLGALLAAVGLRTQRYDSAQALLDALPPAPRGCVVTDVHMAGLSGLQLLRRLQARRIGLPVIVITGRAGAALAAEARAAGAVALLEKPFGPDELIAAVRAALGRS